MDYIIERKTDIKVKKMDEIQEDITNIVLLKNNLHPYNHLILVFLIITSNFVFLLLLSLLLLLLLFLLSPYGRFCLLVLFVDLLIC